MGNQKNLLLLAILVAAPLCAQTDQTQPAQPSRATTLVYKCKNDDGSVTYSGTECSKDPKKMEVVDTHGALRTGSGGHQAEISASVADSDCRDKAYRSTHPESDNDIAQSNQHITDYQQRQRDLQAQGPTYANGVATNNSDSRQPIDDLDAAIARESEYQQKLLANRETAYQNALKACDALKNSAQAQAPARKPAAQDNGGN